MTPSSNASTSTTLADDSSLSTTEANVCGTLGKGDDLMSCCNRRFFICNSIRTNSSCRCGGLNNSGHTDFCCSVGCRATSRFGADAMS